MNIGKLVISFLLFLCFFATASLHAGDANKTILLWGDSLSAGYGVPQDKNWATLLKNRVKDKGYNLVNGSISGETTQGGLNRLPTALERHKPSILIIELGANDGLRGTSLKQMENNLRGMLALALNNNAEVLTLGMKIPPNYGPRYTSGFEKIYQLISAEFDSLLVPFFLEGIATDYDLMQADGLHPNTSAQAKILENVWPMLENVMSVDGS